MGKKQLSWKYIVKSLILSIFEVVAHQLVFIVYGKCLNFTKNSVAKLLKSGFVDCYVVIQVAWCKLFANEGFILVSLVICLVAVLEASPYKKVEAI